MDSSDEGDNESPTNTVKHSFVLPADGFQEECELFLNEAVRMSTFNFTVFRNFYEECAFDSLYEGQLSKEEIMEMSELMVAIATKELVKKKATYKERTAALFLLYIMALSQPIEDFAKIPFTSSDNELIQKFLEEARILKDKEVLFCWANILVRGHCEFTAERQEYGLEDSIQKYFAQDSDDEENTISSLVDFKEELAILDKMRVKMEKYNELKKKSMMRRAKNGKERKALEKKWKQDIETREKVASKVTEGLKNLVTGEIDKTQFDEFRVQAEKIENLKKVAIWSEVKKGKYLVSAKEREKDASTLVQGRNELDDDDDYRDGDIDLDIEPVILNLMTTSRVIQPPREITDMVKEKMMLCRDTVEDHLSSGEVDESSQESICYIPPSYPTMEIDDHSQPASPSVANAAKKEMDQKPGPSGLK